MRQRFRTRSSPTRAGRAPWYRLVARCTSSRRRPRTCSGASRTWWRRLDAARRRARAATTFVPPRPEGPLTAQKVCQAIGATCLKARSSPTKRSRRRLALPASTAGAPRHDWLTLTGGAIGQGLPVAVGAAVACPDRPVIALEADGSALYTIQSLWTMAREQFDVTVVIFNNRRYAILNARARAHRRAERRSQEPRLSSTWGIQTSISSSSAPGSALHRAASTPRSSSPPPLTRPSPIPARISSRWSFPPSPTAR